MGSALIREEAAGKPIQFKPYAGTKVDLGFCSHLWLDLPLSLVADTVRVPVTIPVAASRKSDRLPARTDGGAPGRQDSALIADHGPAGPPGPVEAKRPGGDSLSRSPT